MKVFILNMVLLLLSFMTQSQTLSSIIGNELSNRPLTYQGDSRGDKLLDYSYAGYKGSEVPLPIYSEVVDSSRIIKIHPNETDDISLIDDSGRINEAIKTISNYESKNGFKGVLQFSSGVFYLKGNIKSINTGGIIIRGDGSDIREIEKTLIVDKSGSGSTFFVNGGRPDVKNEVEIDITDSYVSIGSFEFHVLDLSDFKVGDDVLISINPTQKWIDDQGYTLAPWDSNEYFKDRMKLERKIVAIDTTNKKITTNAPITSSINRGDGYNEGVIQKIRKDTRNTNIGFENLILASDYDCNKTDDNGYANDEDHAETGIYFFSGKDAWVKNVTGFFYKKSLIRARNFIDISQNRWEVFHRLTVEDCAMFDGISVNNPKNTSGGGAKEYYFDIDGTSSLVQRTYGRNARHTFILNSPTNLVTFLDCVAKSEHLSSEPHQNFAHGVLFDNIRTDAPLRLNAINSNNPNSHGQRAANSTMWNITSYNKRTNESAIYLDKPLAGLGEQWLIGLKGDDITVKDPSRNIGDVSHVEHVGEHVYPRSLFLRQLKDRIGETQMRKIANDIQANEDPDVVGESITNLLINKYRSIPEFMCIDELINYDANTLEKITELPNGNVGLGTSNPNTKLEIRGETESIRISDSRSHIESGDVIGKIEFSESDSYTDGSGVANYIQSRAYDWGGLFEMDFITGNANNPINTMTLGRTGNVGIGTNSPKTRLDIKGEGESIRITDKRNLLGVDNIIGKLEFYKSDHSTGGPGVPAYIQVRAADLGGVFKMDFFVGSVETPIRAMTLDTKGNMGIGTDSTKGFKLGVNGKIAAEELKIDLYDRWDWPDFVFKENYNLPTLKEVETYINKNGHLKDIPNSEEVNKNGIFVGEINSKLLKKVEELTLYKLKQQKRLDRLKSRKTKIEKERDNLIIQLMELELRLKKMSL